MVRLKGRQQRGRRAGCSFTAPEADGRHVPIFESSQLEVLYVGDFLYIVCARACTRVYVCVYAHMVYIQHIQCMTYS